MIRNFQSRELQRQFLLPLIIVSLGGGLVYLIIGLVLKPDMPLFPLDGLLLTLITLCSLFLYITDRYELAARLVLSNFIWFVVFNMHLFGVRHIWTSLLMPCIIISGLLIGERFQWQMYGLCMIFISLWTTREFLGYSDVINPVSTPDEWLTLILFWGIALGLTTGAVWLFARRLEQEFALSQAQSTALIQTINDLRERLNTDDYLSHVLKNITALLDVHTATLVIHQPDNTAQAFGSMQLTCVHGDVRPTRDDDLLYFLTNPQSRLWQEMRTHGETIFISDIANDTRLEKRNNLLTSQIQSILVMPLYMDDTLTGVLGLSMTAVEPVAPQEIQVIEALSYQIMLALRLSELSDSSRQIAIMKERNRMSREIHDTLMQGLFGVLARLEIAESLLDDAVIQKEALQTQITSACHIVQTGIQEARASVWAMRPHMLADQALDEALQKMLYYLTASTDIATSFRSEGNLEHVAPDTQMHLLRIGQEAVTNALKYANPLHIDVELICTLESISLQVQDDGTGFDPTTVTKGLGLVGMQERAQLLQASLSIDSQKNTGTTITIECEREPIAL